jgi:hypothetical protein
MICQQAGLEAEAAFALLRNYARHHNRKLSDVVTAVNNRDLAAADLRVGRRVPGTAPVT